MNVSRPSAPPAAVPLPLVIPRGGVSTPAPSHEPAEAAAAAPGSLWEVLTPEEREFFAQSEALGTITYRPGRAAAVDAAAPTGRRIDVRG